MEQQILVDSLVLVPKILNHQHLQDMMELQQLAKKQMDSTDTLQPLSRDEFQYIFSGNGLLIGLFDGQQLVAFRALLVPFIDGEHLGMDAGLSLEALSRVVYQELSIVHPAYRGKGLQLQMGEILMDNIDRSRFDYVCATVAPFNIPSLKDKFALGLHIVALKHKYGGKLRYVFLKNLKDEKVEYSRSQDEKLIPMTDTLMQQKLLNEAYVGVGMSSLNEEWHVQYQREF
ncbi:GNAT family N-acetyltransferase [Paenisporosarcina sp. NPDC076898]|uniref:GNAT family N-acetyltransferase n=1 Tax=unclassified Paenisporosarcina TaxID=2642018 RepID=UPI003D023B80